MKNIKVSIVIPVYNIEDYVAKCIKSVISQTYTNLEIIIVDDGSTDGSLAICQSFDDDRIQVCHKENGGLVSARKYGLALATGEYILNVDGDDWIEHDMVAELVAKAVENDADVVTCDIYRDNKNASLLLCDEIPEGVYDKYNLKNIIISGLLFDEKISTVIVRPSLCNKLVKMEMLRNIYEQVDDKMTYGEDMVAITGIILKCNKYVVLHKPLYHYIVRETSIMNACDDKALIKINELFGNLKKVIKGSVYESDLEIQLEKYIYTYMMGVYGNYVGNSSLLVGRYGFAKNIIEAGSNIVLYGAGDVGKSFYLSIKMDKLYNLVGWVDKAPNINIKEKYNVKDPVELIDLKYDYILIAVLRKAQAEKISQELVENYNMDSKKIVWIKPELTIQ